MTYHFTPNPNPDYDFRDCNTRNELNIQLALLGAEYTDRFYEELPRLFPGRNMFDTASRSLLRLDPALCVSYESDTPKQFALAHRNAVEAGPTYTIVGADNQQDFDDLVNAATVYAQQVVEAELRPAVKQWRREHPDQLVIKYRSDVRIPFPRKVRPKNV